MAIFAGEYSHAEQLIAAAAAWGRRIGETDTDGLELTQLFVLGLARQGPAVALQLSRRYGEAWMPPEFRPEQQALIALARGDRSAAAATIAAATPAFERALFRWRALATAALSVEIAVAAGVDCRRWYDELLPFADEFVVIGGLAAVLGPVSLYLGLAAQNLGEQIAAVDWLRDAVNRGERVGSPPLAARARAHLAHVLSTLGSTDEAARLAAAAQPVATSLGLQPVLTALAAVRAAQDVPPLLRRDGDGWLLCYAGARARLRDAKGLQDLATLLANPNRELPATELLAGGPVAAAPGADVVVDDVAKRAYRRRMAELDTELARADAAGDTNRSTRAAAERDQIVAALKHAHGLGGRPRRLGDTSEKARTTVTARIRDSLRRITEVHPQFGAYLQRTVRTGRMCVYRPDSPVVRSDLTP
jgi:hypothetical protein